jgi:hypothetical protein
MTPDPNDDRPWIALLLVIVVVGLIVAWALFWRG